MSFSALWSRQNKREAREGDFTINLYLHEIGQVKLLTPEKEVELAARVKKGDQQARERMIKANLRLVVKIARDYEHLGLPLLDLINEGNIGLMKAVERFDPSKGAKLSRAWWIKQSIKRALANQSKTIRLPVHLVDRISRMNRAALRLHDVFGREPTDEEGQEIGLSAARVAKLRTAAIRPASLDAPIGDEDSTTLADVLPDENAGDALPAARGQDDDSYAAGADDNVGCPGDGDPAPPLWPGRGKEDDLGGGRRKVWRVARASPPSPEHCPAQTS
jgi:RNA polymerase primary sigma factor